VTYKIEELHYMDGGYTTHDNATLRVLMAEALSMIPQGDAELIIESARFLIVASEQLGVYLIPAEFDGKALVVFASDLFDKPKEEQVKTFLHEAAPVNRKAVFSCQQKNTTL
jgi:hypothetical protein